MPSITVNALGLLCVPVLATIFILFPVTLLRSPLNKVPSAHWSCSLSRFWILWTRYKNRELAVLDEKHRQLGPIIRVGPAELSVSCYDSGVRTIYNGGFEKPEYYDFFAYYDTKNAFCSLSRHDHTLRRKRITAAYTRTSLFRSQQLSSLTEIILFARLLPILQQQALAVKPTDILSLSYALSLDLITCFQFGLSSGSDFLQTPDSLPPWLEHYEHRYCKEAFWPQELPILTRCFNFMGKTMLPRSYFHSKRFLEDWLLEMCDRAEVVHATSAKEGMTHACDTPVVYQLVKSAVDADSPETSFDARRKEIASELFDEMSGGREVLGLVLAYTIYYISQNRSAQTRLRAELETLNPSMRKASHEVSNDEQRDDEACGMHLPSPSSLDKLPYLSAILKESFRMRPTSTPLPRITPQDRAVSLAGIDGIPPGTRVNTFQWFIHRNPDNYSRVNEWCPERFLDAEPKDGKTPLLWAFGGGSRMCVGVSLTQYLMRYILALIYSNFTSKVVSKKAGVYEPGSAEDEIMVLFERI